MLAKKSKFEDLLRPSSEIRAPLTKILCTIGPASESPEVLTQLLESGVQGFRIDLAWADQEWADKALATLAQVSEATGKTPAVILDTSGPEIRVCNTAKACLRKQNADASAEGVVFQEGGEVMLCRGGDIDMCSSAVPVDCSKTFTELAIEVGAVLHISSYLSAGSDLTTLSLEVCGVNPDKLQCRCVASCTLPGNVKLTLHGGGVHTRMPILSESDKRQIAHFKDKPSSIHFLNVSYCRTAGDVQEVRTYLKGIRMQHVGVMAKICTPDAASRCNDIIASADGIVLGRGTLGLELPPEKVFVAQKLCLSAANLAGKIAVVTRVVDTMVHAPRPTRAEATDVANLVLDGADCILLGAETFRGMQPVTAAQTVRAICRQAETVYDSESFYNKLMDGHGGFRGANLSATEALASSAVRATSKLGAKLVLAFTKTGRTVRYVAKYRSSVPILTVIAQGGEGSAPKEMIARQCALLRGVTPMLAPATTSGAASVDGSMTDWALEQAQDVGLVKKGDRVVVSQCPRLLQGGMFKEAAVVKFVVVGEAVPQNFPKHGSCMDMQSMQGRHGILGNCTQEDGPRLASVEV